MLVRFFSIHGYYFFLALGAVSMLILMLWRRHEYALSIMQAFVYTLLLLIIGIAGAKLLYFFECGMKSFAGMSFFGSVYLVLLLMPVIGLLFRLRPSESLDACAPCVASIIGFMRFGCWCAGCCGGISTTIGNTSFAWPTQFIEGAGDMGILLLLLGLEQRGMQKGKLYFFFLIPYGILRSLVEIVRDTPKDWCGFSHGQWFSILGIILAAVIIWSDSKWKERNNHN